MRSSTTPPSSAQHRVYCAWPGAIRSIPLVRQASTYAAAPGPRTDGLAQVRDVEDADGLAHGCVLLEDATTGIVDGHLPPAEVGELGAEGYVPVVERGVSQSRVSHERRRYRCRRGGGWVAFAG